MQIFFSGKGTFYKPIIEWFDKLELNENKYIGETEFKATKAEILKMVQLTFYQLVQKFIR